MNSIEYFLQIIYSLKVTISLSLSSAFLGLLLGFLGALGEKSFPVIRIIFQYWHMLVRALPELIVIFIFYFGLNTVLAKVFNTYIEVNAFFSGVIGLSVIFGAYASQIIHAAQNSIDQGEIDAALSLGMSIPQVFFRISFRNIIRHAFPGLTNLWLVVLKDSSIVSTIGVVDIMRASETAAAQNFSPLKFYLFASFLYLILTGISYIIVSFSRNKFYYGEQYE